MKGKVKNLEKIKVILSISIGIVGFFVVFVVLHYKRAISNIEEAEPEITVTESSQNFGKTDMSESLKITISLTEHYITHIGDPGNFYYIDDNNVLWGSGRNEYGQLGQGTQDYEFHDEGLKIAEDVVHVDYSQKGFAIFLTNDYKLYGIGNAGGGALGQYEEFDWTRYTNGEDYVVTTPILLMEDVVYANCGRDDIVCLKDDGTIWTWGTVYAMNCMSNDVYYIAKPEKILEDAVFVTGGWYNHAALLQDGTVWTWGNNSAGNCGVADVLVVKKPTLVAEDVTMVWTNLAITGYPQPDVEQIELGWTGDIKYDTEYESILEFGDIYPYYLNNTVIQKTDGSYWVCGEDVGTEEKIVHGVEGDYSIICNYEFFPCINQNREETLIKFYNNRAFEFNNVVYVFLGENLWKIDSSQQIISIIECEEAVGFLRGEYLYWAVWKDEGTISIIRINKENQIFEVGILEKDMPPDMLDFYKDVIYIRYESGKVEGYHLNQNGEIGEEASIEEMQLYVEENQATEKNLHEQYSAQCFLKYLVPAGYAREICGKEFLSKYIRQGESGFWQMIERSNEQDRILFTFYEQAVIDNGKVIYFDSTDKNKLEAYDLLKEEKSVIYEFKDGTFDFLAVEENVIYGIWNSAKQLKSYFVGIDTENSKMMPYFEIKVGQEYMVINKIVYYMDDGEIVICPIDESLKKDLPQMDVLLAWSYLKDEYFSYCDTEKISYDVDGRLLIVIGEQRMPFSSDGEYYRCESVVDLDDVNGDNYVFEHHYVYYEDNGAVYALKTGSRYCVDCYTGEIIKH